MHQHKVPIKSADSILDEFLFGRTLKDNSTLKRPHETSSKLKMSSPTSQQSQNLLFTISGNRRDSEAAFGNHLNDSNLSSSSSNVTAQIKHIQRKLVGFFLFILLLSLAIIVTLYMTVAVYSYYQLGHFRPRHQQLVVESTPQNAITPASSTDQDSTLDLSTSEAQTSPNRMPDAIQTKLEGKLHLLERYIEMLAIDLEETKNRLQEREKCACSIGCSFNGTRYTDGQRWQQNCDVCTCQSGKISCKQRECPKLGADCEDQVQLPGQCCASCMKKCKVNNRLVRHGHTFKPSNTSVKRCKCHDGLVKCEPVEQNKERAKLSPEPKNRTLEYLQTILGPRRQPQVQLVLMDKN